MLDLTKLDLSHLSDPHLSTARDIVAYYHMMKDREQYVNDWMPVYKTYFILAYNLFDVGFPDEAMYILNNDISSAYYSKEGFLADMEYGVKMRQEAEDCKNNPKDKAKFEACMQEAEVIIVFDRMIKRLQNTDFDHKKRFMDFLGTLVGNEYKLELKPKIGLVKD